MTVTTTAATATVEQRHHGLAARYYTDPEVFAAELERVFARTWVMVGHQCEVAEPGDVITAQVGDESILVANDSGRLRAMYNVCQHRGHQLVASQSARLDRITCPYHAWTYGLDGRLLHARGEDVGQLCVPQARLETLAGFMFVNLDSGAAPLADIAAGVEDELLALAPDAPRRVLAARLTHEMRANWKVVVENYNECYHCPNVHKWFTQGVIAPGSYLISSHGSVIRHTAAAPAKGVLARGEAGGPDQAGASPEAERGVRAQDAAGGAKGVGPVDPAASYGAFYFWPLSSIQCYLGRVLNTFRWVPISVDRTLLIREWWCASADPSEDEAALISGDWEQTVAEDFVIVESVQRGLASRGYSPGPLIEDPSGVCGVHSENTVRHLQTLLQESLGDAA